MRNVSVKEVKNQNLRNFELGSHESMNVPIWIFIGFQQPDRQESQNWNNDSFRRLPNTSAQCSLATEKHPDADILIKYDVDDSNRGYGPIKEGFRA